MKKAILWLHSDFRIEDLRAFAYARENSLSLTLLYLHRSVNRGSASKWMLHHSLSRFQKRLSKAGVELSLLNYSPGLLLRLCKESGYSAVLTHFSVEPDLRMKFHEVQKELAEEGFGFKVFKGNYLLDFSSILTGKGTPFKVFTPFFKTARECILNQPEQISEIPYSPASFKSLQLSDLNLLPRIPWDREFYNRFPPEKDSEEVFEVFLLKIENYEEQRDLPSIQATSQLSAYLHFGEISVFTVLSESFKLKDSSGRNAFIRQLFWREFSAYLLYHFQNLYEEPMQSKFKNFPYQDNEDFFKAWQQGRTGYPIIDAGMKELWHTGSMHNRVRMLVASFLVKNLRIHWKRGFEYFMDTLVDADYANNLMGWQWVAGCGADAAPYFRIFNPVSQSMKFDPEGKYIKQYLPGLKNRSFKSVHLPLEADSMVKDLDPPIVDLKQSRLEALSAYKKLSQNS